MDKQEELDELVGNSVTPAEYEVELFYAAMLCICFVCCYWPLLLDTFTPPFTALLDFVRDHPGEPASER